MTDDEMLTKIGRLFDMLAEPLRAEILDLHMKANAQRYLLEQVYANRFLSDAEGFRELMAGLTDFSKQKPSKSGPIDDESMQEQLVRLTVHLDRFRDAVLLRISQGVR